MKLKIVLFLIVVSLVFGVFSPLPIKAYQPIDQVNSNGIDGYWKIKTHNWVAQTFKPTKDRLDAIGFRASGNGGSADITVWLNDYTTGTNVGAWPITITDGEKWSYVDFTPDLEINASHQYAIYLSTDSNNAYWGAATTNMYVNGAAIVDNAVMGTQDFAFITYGYNYVATPDPTPVPSDTGTPVPSPTASSTPAPTPTATPTETAKVPDKAVTSIVVEAANNLTATYNKTTKAVDLAWEKSATSSITGYKVLRSEKKDSDFVQLTTVKADVLKYSDTTVKADKTYYYIVKAYQDDIESKNSNTASVVISNSSATPTTTPTTSTTDKKASTNWLLVAVLSAACILVIGLIIYFIAKNKKKVEGEEVVEEKKEK